MFLCVHCNRIIIILVANCGHIRALICFYDWFYEVLLNLHQSLNPNMISWLTNDECINRSECVLCLFLLIFNDWYYSQMRFFDNIYRIGIEIQRKEYFCKYCWSLDNHSVFFLFWFLLVVAEQCSLGSLGPSHYTRQ